MKDAERIRAASQRLHDRKASATQGRQLLEATDERIGQILVGTDLTIDAVKRAVNEWLMMFEQRIGLPNPSLVEEHLGDIVMDAFLTGVFYEQLRSDSDGA